MVDWIPIVSTRFARNDSNRDEMSYIKMKNRLNLISSLEIFFLLTTKVQAKKEENAMKLRISLEESSIHLINIFPALHILHISFYGFLNSKI